MCDRKSKRELLLYTQGKQEPAGGCKEYHYWHQTATTSNSSTHATTTLVRTAGARLAAQAQLINQLSDELETAMFELKAIASQISCQQRLHNKPQTKTCQFAAAIVPNVKRNKAGEFLLTSRTVDLFRAEREATELAQKLRERANKNKRCLN